MLLIERLNVSRHDRGSFDCGVTSLNTYLQQYARQFSEKNVGVTWVAVHDNELDKIIGYYTLSVGSLIPNELPTAKIALPQLPIILLGRLAVDKDRRGKNIGRRLLLHAMQHTYNFSTHIGIYAMVVDALDDNARNFYLKFGFLPLPSNPFRLYLSLRAIAQLER